MSVNSFGDLADGASPGIQELGIVNDGLALAEDLEQNKIRGGQILDNPSVVVSSQSPASFNGTVFFFMLIDVMHVIS